MSALWALAGVYCCRVPYLLSFRSYSLAFRAPVRTAHGVWSRREGYVVRLEGPSGKSGYGEAAPIPGFGVETPKEIGATLARLGESVSREQIDALPERLGCLQFALTTAWAEATAAPGGAADPGAYLPLAALLPAGRPALATAVVKGEAGFRTFKWKVGVGDAGDELALMDDLIAALPTGSKLRLDANGAWNFRQATKWLERCAERPVEFVEQPIGPSAKGAEDALAGLAADYPTPVALDESVSTSEEIGRWLDRGWPGVFVLKPALMGASSAIARRLQRQKAAVVFSSALETAVGARAALRLAFAWGGEPRALGFGVWPLFSDAIFDGPHLAPFIRRSDVESLDPERVWTALA